MASWDKLGQAASVMQVTGVDAFGLVSMIVQAAQTARQNRDLCQQVSLHVQIVADLLRKLDIPELRRHPETRRPLEQLDAALFRAYKLVRSCSQQQENRGKLYQMLTGSEVASKLRLAQEEIDRYINLIPMITLVALVSAQRGNNNEVHEDVSNDGAPTLRDRLSLQQVAESLTLEELPPQGPSVDIDTDATRNGGEDRRNNAWQLVKNVRNGLVDQMGRYLTYGPMRIITGTKQNPIYGEEDDVFQMRTDPQRFSYRQLWQATRGFSDDQKLVQGRFGSVYRGFLQDQGLYVAVKRVSMTSNQERREYIDEVNILSRLKHCNLVKFIGWCHESDEVLLAYELMMNGSLDDHLNSTGNTLTWPIRYNIILGMGSAIQYLHGSESESEQHVLHRNIKASSVMLDSLLNAKLGPFGLARLIDHSCPAHTTVLGATGTKGCTEPECVASTGSQSDVYSFGVVLLQTACLRKPVVPREDETKLLLVQWVWDLYGRGQLLEAGDPGLREFNAQEMERSLVVGLWCVHPDYEARPSIQQAMNVLLFQAPPPELPLQMPRRVAPRTSRRARSRGQLVISYCNRTVGGRRTE